MSTIDNLELPVTSKLWLYQHFVVSKLAWPFTSLDLSLTFVHELEAVANRFLKRWSGLPRGGNTAILHLGSSNRAGLHVKQLSTFWKQMQVVRMDILKHSADPRCRRIYDRSLASQSQWSRKYPPAVEHACASTVVEANAPELVGQPTSAKSQPDRRKRILNIISEIDTESQLAKLKQLAVQGRWLEWTDAMHSDLSWRRLIHGLDDGELRFNLRVITNTLPTPDNLRRWGQTEVDPACPLCGKQANLRHILSGCSVAFLQGRYTWRHDSTLKVLQRHLTSFWKHIQKEPFQGTAPFIHLVKEGAPRLPSHQRDTRPLLSDNVLRCARDWQFLFDIGTGYSFPIEIAVTRKRPDIVIYSRSLRIVILIELTVPHEDKIAAANLRKTVRYSELLASCENNDWHATHFPVEVGSRGWVAHSLISCLQKLGFSASWRNKVRRECSRVALRCSYLLYLRRSIKPWNNINELSPDLPRAKE